MLLQLSGLDSVCSPNTESKNQYIGEMGVNVYGNEAHFISYCGVDCPQVTFFFKFIKDSLKILRCPGEIKNSKTGNLPSQNLHSERGKIDIGA